MKLFSLLPSFFIILCSACAVTPRTYSPILTADEKTSVPTVKIVSIVNQKDIKGQYLNNRPAYVAYTSLELALTMAAVNPIIGLIKSKVASTKVAPHRELLSGYDTNKTIHDALAKHAEKSGFSINEFIIHPQDEKVDISSYIEDFSDENLLIVSSDYSLGPYLNLIHLEASALLVLGEDPSKRNKKRTHYHTKTWKTLYQSPKIITRYTPKSPADLEQEIKEINRYYSSKIQKASLGRQQTLKKSRNKKIIRAKQRRHNILDSPIERQNWTAESLKAEIESGIELLAIELFTTPALDITAEDFEKKLVELPFSQPTVESETGFLIQNKAEPKSSISAIKLHEKEEFTTLLTHDNVKYIYPKNETLQVKAVLSRH